MSREANRKEVWWGELEQEEGLGQGRVEVEPTLASENGIPRTRKLTDENGNGPQCLTNSQGTTVSVA